LKRGPEILLNEDFSKKSAKKIVAKYLLKSIKSICYSNISESVLGDSLSNLKKKEDG